MGSGQRKRGEGEIRGEAVGKVPWIKGLWDWSEKKWWLRLLSGLSGPLGPPMAGT